ncbi:MAG TPA: hypothetical protein VF199_07865 [Bacillales bacterium]
MSSKKEEKRNTEIEHPEIREVEHKTLHPKPDMTRDVPGRFSTGETNDFNSESGQDY